MATAMGRLPSLAFDQQALAGPMRATVAASASAATPQAATTTRRGHLPLPTQPPPKKSTLAQQLDRQHRAEVEQLKLAQAVRAERQCRLLATLIDARRSLLLFICGVLGVFCGLFYIFFFF